MSTASNGRRPTPTCIRRPRAPRGLRLTALAIGLLPWIPRAGVAQQASDSIPPSLQTRVEKCLSTHRKKHRTVLFGVVVDSVTQSPLSGVTLTLRPAKAARGFPGREAMSTKTERDGTYLFCGAPQKNGQMIDIIGMGWIRRHDPVDLGRPEPVFKRIDLPLSKPGQRGNLIGKVVDQETGLGVNGAEVRIEPEDLTTSTSGGGTFTFSGLSSGMHRLTVQHLSYGEKTDSVRVFGGRAVEVKIPVAMRPIALEPITVTVAPMGWFRDMEGLYRRMNLGRGYFITRSAIKKQGAPRMTDVLRGIPGVRVKLNRRQGRSTFYVVMRGAHTIDASGVGFTDCPPVFYIDGVKDRTSQDLDAFDPDAISVYDIEAIEVYRGPAEVPPQFIDADTRCGVVAVWTRRGGD